MQRDDIESRFPIFGVVRFIAVLLCGIQSVEAKGKFQVICIRLNLPVTVL